MTYVSTFPSLSFSVDVFFKLSSGKQSLEVYLFVIYTPCGQKGVHHTLQCSGKSQATRRSFISQRNCCSMRESVLISGLYIHCWQFSDIGQAGEARGEVWWRRGRVRETLHLLSVCALGCLLTLILNRGSVGFTAPCITCRPWPPFIRPSVHPSLYDSSDHFEVMWDIQTRNDPTPN